MPLLPCAIVLDPAAYASDPDDPDARFAFDDLRGLFQPKQEQLEELERLGTDGEEYRATGIRGKKFVINTRHYVADRQAALDAMVEYVTLKDGNPYAVIQHGQNWGYFKVLDVIQSMLVPCANVVGSLIFDPTMKQGVDFLLVSTDPPEAP